MNRRAFCLLFALPLLTAPLFARTQPPATEPDKKAAIARRVEEEIAKQKIPGIGYAVVIDNRIFLSQGAGYADMERKERATGQTRWRLASISKTFTAAAAMRQVEQGKLDLDAPVQKYVGSLFPEKPWPVTTRELLGHLGGVRHYRANEVDSMVHYTNVLDPLKIFSNDPLEHEPGTKYLYTTYGFCLIGAVVEKAAGRPFTDLVKESVFRPAGMRDTEVDDITQSIRYRATGYLVGSDGILKPAPAFDATNKIPGGGFVSTSTDLARYAIAMMSDNKVVRNETRAQMWTNGKTTDGKATGYGLGWGVSAYKSDRVIAHSGGQPGVATLLWMLPERKFAVVLLTNRDGAALTGLAKALADIALQ